MDWASHFSHKVSALHMLIKSDAIAPLSTGQQLPVANGCAKMAVSGWLSFALSGSILGTDSGAAILHSDVLRYTDSSYGDQYTCRTGRKNERTVLR